MVPIEREADIVAARQKGRELAASLGFSSTDQTLLATAISEVARNIVTYAGKGRVTLTSVQDGLRRGLIVVAKDEGPGIADIELALRDGYSTGKSLGLGLPGARRLVDSLAIESVVGVGTTVTLTKWLR
jgi:serine/threonine-protein kinase RsbT